MRTAWTASPGKRAFYAGMAILALVGATPAQAVEDGMSPWPKGFMGFMSGFVPPQQALYVSTPNYYFAGSAHLGSYGGPAGGGLGVQADFTLDNKLPREDWLRFVVSLAGSLMSITNGAASTTATS